MKWDGKESFETLKNRIEGKVHKYDENMGEKAMNEKCYILFVEALPANYKHQIIMALGFEGNIEDAVKAANRVHDTLYPEESNDSEAFLEDKFKDLNMEDKISKTRDQDKNQVRRNRSASSSSSDSSHDRNKDRRRDKCKKYKQHNYNSNGKRK